MELNPRPAGPLGHLVRLEEGAEAAMMASASFVRGTVSSVSQAAKETRLLQAVQVTLCQS
eukprot:3011779-Pyramimonas_sp.AAC.1